ncbi:MAG: hypothetical protein GEU73_00900 [Chloroflexi bacterium]|nr:hypothetical protein [Chloroflexota bacterium]
MNAEGIERVAIVGAGEMGSNISTVCALAGYPVAISDLSREILDRSLRRVRRNLDVLVEAEEITRAQADAATARVRPAADLRDAAADADLMIEAVPERLDLKQEVFLNVEGLARDDAILASNASGIPTSEIAARCRRPERVVGIHFFQPPFVLRVVEAIRGEKTSSETFEAVVGFIESLGSVPLRVLKDRHSFVINALQQALRKEVAALLDAGVASKDDIETAALYCLGPKYSTFGLLRSGDLTSPMSPLRRGEVNTSGLNYDYTKYGVDEAFRRRDLAMIELVKAAARIRSTYPLE